MRNQFMCEIPESVRVRLSRQAIEDLDQNFDELDDALLEERDDVDALSAIRQLLNCSRLESRSATSAVMAG